MKKNKDKLESEELIEVMLASEAVLKKDWNNKYDKRWDKSK